MRKILIFLFLASGLCSCVTQNRCNSKFPLSEKDSTSTVVTYETYWDTINIPREELSFDTSGIVPLDIIFSHIERKGHLKQTLDIRNGKITQTCVSDSLSRYIEKLRASKTVYQVKHITKMIPCDREHRTKRDAFCLYFTGISLLLILIAFIAWLVRKYLKPG
jgi:hypothetical protein